MKVVFLCGHYEPQRCGVSHYTQKLRACLAAEGVSSNVLTTYHAAQSAREAQASDQPGGVEGVIRDWRWTALLPMARAIHQSGGDVLHIQFAQGSYRFRRPVLWLPFLLRLTGWRKPVVVTLHEYGNWEWFPDHVPPAALEWLKTFGQQRGWWDREDGFLLTNADRIVSTNENTDSLLSERLVDGLARVRRISLAANVEVQPISRARARRALREALGWGLEDAVISFFGFIHPVKGIETLLAAFRQVHAQLPRTRLLMMGGMNTLSLQPDDAAQYMEGLRARLAAEGLADSALFTGYLPSDRASLYLSGSDVGVLPFNHGVNLKSGSLLALLAHGLPVVATRHDPPVGWLEDGRMVQVVAPKDSQGLARALLRYLNEPVLRARHAQAGMDFAASFGWKAITRAHLKLYGEMLDVPHRHTRLKQIGVK